MRLLSGFALILLLSAVMLGQAAAPQPAAPPSVAQQSSTPPTAAAPQSAAPAAPATPAADPADVKSVDAILAAIYDVISGPAGDRDWPRFQSLFLPEAHLIVNGKNAKGVMRHRVITPAEYQQLAGASFRKEGFFEHSVHNDVDEFAGIAQVFSTYESRHEKDGKPFERGINSFQLLFDGERWWIVNIMWANESAENPIPPQFLPKS